MAGILQLIHSFYLKSHLLILKVVLLCLSIWPCYNDPRTLNGPYNRCSVKSPGSGTIYLLLHDTQVVFKTVDLRQSAAPGLAEVIGLIPVEVTLDGEATVVLAI